MSPEMERATTDNFNDDGTLAVPMRATLDPDDGNAMESASDRPRRSRPSARTVEAANNAVKALEEAQAKNVRYRNLDIRAYEEAYTEGPSRGGSPQRAVATLRSLTPWT